MTYVDESFRRPVKLHILANFLTDIPEFPLMLGVFGPPGEGKTYQVGAVCEEIGVSEQLISPGELESENAGAPAQLLRREYLKASARTREGHPTALVIHDIDTVLGNWGDLVQYTVNRQVVYAQLMAFCDFPLVVNGHKTARVPIIITGNNPSIIYGPLMRAGRIRLLSWAPNISMRLKIVSSLFPHVDVEHLRNLLGRHASSPVSFWADVRSCIVESRVGAAIDDIGDRRVRDLLTSGSKLKVSTQISITEIEAAAARLAAGDIRSANYLRADAI